MAVCPRMRHAIEQRWRRGWVRAWAWVLAGTMGAGGGVLASENVYLTGMPDYDWWAGCFGTATGNVMGYWDRHGFSHFYTGTAGGGVAPMNTSGINFPVVSMWASQAGLDGRPADQPGHYDDYYVGYESVEPDPYVTAQRVEHRPDCLGDFIGLNQRKFPDLDGECSGNIDAYSFVYWDKSGQRRVNFTPSLAGGTATQDIQSGMREWVKWKGSEGDVFTQLASFNPQVPVGAGFTFEDVRAEIDAGYPFMVFLQGYDWFSRTMHGQAGVNPNIHGMVVYGYVVDDAGNPYVRCRTSWASGDSWFGPWDGSNWVADGDLPVRGVIGFRPKPKIRSIERAGGQIRVRWEGPLSELYDTQTQSLISLHGYVVEMARQMNGSSEYAPVADAVVGTELTFQDPNSETLFLRLRLVRPGTESTVP